MRASGLIALLALVAATAPARGATVLEKRIEVNLRPDGSFSERVRIAVRLERDGDADRWSRQAVALDVNRSLRSFSASVTGLDGRENSAPRKAFDTQGGLDEGGLATSQRFRVVALPSAPKGSIYRFEWETEERPWFPGTVFLLGEADPVEELEVVVNAPGRQLRAELSGPATGLTFDRTTTGLRVHGAMPGESEIDLPPGALNRGPLLVAGWGDAGWEEVGRWFESVSRDLPHGGAEVRAAAATATATAGSRREEVARLLASVRRGVRYASLQIGIGGYRPAPAADTLARKWGDCKAKAFLLIDLLAERGIPAWPLLVRLAADERPPGSLASPYLFNHLIVAADAVAAGAVVTDPVVDGLLVLDPTAERGGIEWLPAALQGQPALLARGAESRLLALPERAAYESARVTLAVAVDARGDATGTVRMELEGSLAAAVASSIARQPDTTEGIVLRELATRLPGAEFARPRWSIDDRALPRVELEASMGIRAIGESTTDGLELLLAGPNLLPSVRSLTNRSLPFPLAAGSEEVRWQVTLPTALCAPRAQDSETAGSIGAVTLRTTASASGFERVVTSRLERGWIEPESFEELRRLAVAEARADGSALSVSCAEPR